MFREMRRKDRQIGEEIGIELLTRADDGVLSVLGDDDYPYGVPVNFVYADNNIYIHGFLDGHKMDAVRKHPKVCFTVVGETEVLYDQISTNYTSAIAFGKAEVLPFSAEEERAKALALLMEKYIPGDLPRTNEYIKSNDKKTNIIRISIEHMTCKRRDIK